MGINLFNVRLKKKKILKIKGNTISCSPTSGISFDISCIADNKVLTISGLDTYNST